MSIFWLVPFLFLTLIPSLWAEKSSSGGFITLQIFRFVFGVFYAWLLSYVFLMDHTFTAFFISTFWLIPIIVFFDWMYNISEGNKTAKDNVLFLLLSIITFAIWLFMVTIYPMSTKNDMYNLVHTIEKADKLEATDIDHIPTVPLEFAQYKGRNILGSLQNPSYYDLGEYTRQKINNEEYWVAPIEYAGFFKSNSAGFIPGYVKISAEVKDKPAELVTNFKMKYVPSGYFSNNLERRVRGNYPNVIIMGVSFEPDDSGKPYYVVAVGRYKDYRFGSIVDGAIIVDPQDGSMKYYNLDKVPDYVDFVIPASIAQTYNEYQGDYKHGFWNSIFSKTDVHNPTKWSTGEEVIGVFGPDKRMYWFTDHTTATGNSSSMVGYTLMDGRTGKYTYYTGSKGFSNGSSALAAVHNTYKNLQWVGTNPILYNIYGEDTWYIPVIDSNGLLKEIAIVNAKNTQILAHNANKADALAEYKYKLATEQINGKDNPTDVSNTKNIVGNVIRISHTNISTEAVVQLLLNNSDKIFNINQSQYAYAGFIEQGDSVRIDYIDTGESIATVQKIFDNQLGK